jgi:type II secretory pathway component GspD/PulD (secretin)
MKLKNLMKYLSFVFFCISSCNASAQFKTKSVELFSDRKPVAEFLREFAAKANVDIFIEPNVTGTISGQFKGSPAAVLNEDAALNLVL